MFTFVSSQTPPEFLNFKSLALGRVVEVELVIYLIFLIVGELTPNIYYGRSADNLSLYFSTCLYNVPFN